MYLAHTKASFPGCPHTASPATMQPTCWAKSLRNSFDVASLASDSAASIADVSCLVMSDLHLTSRVINSRSRKPDRSHPHRDTWAGLRRRDQSGCLAKECRLLKGYRRADEQNDAPNLQRAVSTAENLLSQEPVDLQMTAAPSASTSMSRSRSNFLTNLDTSWWLTCLTSPKR